MISVVQYEVIKMMMMMIIIIIIIIGDAQTSFWPIIGRPVIGTKQSADYWPLPINGFSPIRRMVTPTILRLKSMINFGNWKV